MGEVFEAIEILSQLKFKYKEKIRPEIISVSLWKDCEAIYLETLELQYTETGFEKKILEKIDLYFITTEDGEDNIYPYFDPNDSLEENVLKFINDFDEYSIINTTNLFTTESEDKISKKKNVFNIDY